MAIAAVISLLLNNNKPASTLPHKPASISCEVKYPPDYAVSGTIPGLIAISDYVVYGHYEKFIEDWEMGDKHMSEACSFVVDESLLGNAKDTIKNE